MISFAAAYIWALCKAVYGRRINDFFMTVLSTDSTPVSEQT